RFALGGSRRNRLRRDSAVVGTAGRSRRAMRRVRIAGSSVLRRNRGPGNLLSVPAIRRERRKSRGAVFHRQPSIGQRPRPCPLVQGGIGIERKGDPLPGRLYGTSGTCDGAGPGGGEDGGPGGGGRRRRWYCQR